jgi:uncharacterized protein (DUF952 family)
MVDSRKENYLKTELSPISINPHLSLVKSGERLQRSTSAIRFARMSTPELIYKIATEVAYAPARGAASFAGMPIDAADGYMHFSTAAQLAETLRLHFAGQDGLVLLAVRSADLGERLVWEPSRGGALFPHLYDGPLPLAAVQWEVPLSVAADGSCSLPEGVR